MSDDHAIWGIHLEWDDEPASQGAKDIAIGWHALGDLSAIPTSRDAFKAAFIKAYPNSKPGAVPVKAGVPYRFAKEMTIGDIIVYPSRSDRLVNIGLIAGNYSYLPNVSAEYPHRRRVDWKAHIPRAQFSQSALYEIGSAITLFRISENAEEFLAALHGKPFKVAEVDAEAAADIAVQADESVEDFIIKRLKNNLTDEQFEHFCAGLLRCMGYHVRVTRHSGDGGVDIIAHRDELGFEGPIIRAQCKQTFSTIGGPDVQRLLGAIQTNENALFFTLGDYSSDAVRIERGKSNLRLINGSDLVQLIFNNYEKLEPQFKTLLPLKRSYSPSVVQNDLMS